MAPPNSLKLAAILVTVLASLSQNSVAQGNFRLPLNLIPSHYDIKLIARLEESLGFTFSGVVAIDFTCQEATDTIILHNYELVVDEASVTLVEKSSGTELPITGHEYDWDYAEFQTISLAETLEEGKEYTLTIPYDGVMNTFGAGLWHDWYYGDQGREEFAATQLQATSARAVYPCFDEPGLKATFDISIGHPEELKSFSNMPTKASGDPVEGEPGYIWDIYDTTPVMSTYLVATVIGDYQQVPSLGDERQFITVPSELANEVKLAQEAASVILQKLEEKWETPFPLPKLEHAAVPFFGGGMENYGLIIYDEYGLIDDGFSLTLVAHETAHMWTGDLVTCQWWDVTWLNEGMTHFSTFYITDETQLDVSFDYFDYLGSVLMDSAMDYDASPSALPMVIPIAKPSDINYAFSGALIYNRGGNTGRVMYLLLGDEPFRAALKEYFAENAYKPVREEDLFSKFEASAQAAGLDLPLAFGDIMTPWTNQPGYPLVTVTRGEAADGKISFEISQKRHLDVDGNNHNDDSLWPVPVNVASKSSASRVFMVDQSMTVEVEAAEGDWVAFNDGRSGYYRVNYDTESWNLLLDAVEAGDISGMNRAAIASDGFTLCYWNLVETDVCNRLPDFLKNEKNLNVWSVAARGLHKMIAKADDKRAAADKMKIIVEVAEFRTMRTREAMTPRRKNLLDFLGAFRDHLSGSNYEKPFYTKQERMWSEKFAKKQDNLKTRLAHGHKNQRD